MESAISRAHESIAQEQEDKAIDIVPMQWVINQFPHWKRWYLKKNQPKNYFRVTRIIPIIPNATEIESCWIMKFQIWVNGALHSEYRIDNSTFEFFQKQVWWEDRSFNDMDISILKPNTI